MQIDKQAEALGRQAIHWVGARDREKFLSSIDNIANDTQRRDEALAIYCAVAAVLLRMVHSGGVPSQGQNEELASKIVARHPWELINSSELYSTLESLAADPPQPQVEGPTQIVAIFMIAGHLLAKYHRGLGHEDPYGLLDEVLNRIAVGGES